MGARVSGFFRGFVKAMRELGNRRAARTISLALVAGLVAFEAVLAVTAGAIGIPGVLLVPLGTMGGERANGSGGESVIAKQPAQAAEAVTTASAEQAGASVETALPQQAGLSATAFLDSSAAMPPPVMADAPVIATEPVADVSNSTKDPAKELNLASISTPPNLEEPAEDAKSEPRQTLRNSTPTEDLPWEDTVPVPLSQLVPQASAASGSASRLQMGDIQAWVKSKAAALAGGVDDRGRALYRFELWVEPPAEVKQRLVSVAYDFGSPSAQPRTQESSEHETGFRVRYGSLSCADKITLTLKFNDGQSQQLAVNGCKLQG
jgi:hypothetical protein